MKSQPLSVIQSIPVWLQQTETWIHSSITSLPFDRVVSHVVCDRTKNIDQFEYDRIHAFSADHRVKWNLNRFFKRFQLPFRFGQLKSRVAELNADIVHTHFGDNGIVDSLAIRHTSAKHVVTFYGHDVSQLPRRRPEVLGEYQDMFRHIDGVLCEGPFMADRVASFGCPKHLIHVQRLGVDLSRFKFCPRAWRPGTPLKILIAGSFREKKGIPFALQALAQLDGSVDFYVTVIGDANNSQASIDEKNKILQIVQSSGITDRVSFVGYQPHSEMTRLSYEHHLFVSTSVEASDGDNEGGAPVTLIEMAATGIPIVSSTHCDIPEVIVHNETGWLAAERNVDEICECIEAVLSNHNNWESILSRGRQRMETMFDLKQQGLKQASLYESIARG